MGGFCMKFGSFFRQKDSDKIVSALAAGSVWLSVLGYSANFGCHLWLGSRRPGELPERGGSPKAVGGGCKRSWTCGGKVSHRSYSWQAADLDIARKGKSPRVVRGGYKRSFGSKGLPRVFCTTQNLPLRRSATPFRTGSKRSSLPGTKRPLNPERKDIPPPSPISGQKAFSRGGGWVYILRVCATEILSPPPPFYAPPPPLEGYFQGWGGGCIEFGPALKTFAPSPLTTFGNVPSSGNLPCPWLPKSMGRVSPWRWDFKDANQAPCSPAQALKSVVLQRFAWALRGNTIRGNRTRNSERKMAVWEGVWEGLKNL